MQSGALSGERDVREAYAAHAGELYGFAVRSLGDAGLAEEAVQETFLRAWRAGERFDPQIGSLHRRLLPTLGTALGEMFALEELAAACRRDGRFSFFFVAAPLNLPNGIGSPGNAVAIR